MTFTGVCEPGKEVELWRCEDARETSLRGITFTDPSGNNSNGGTEVEGPSAVLTVKSPSTTEVVVRIEAFNWAKAPTPEEIQDILGDSEVTVDCVSPYVSHESETYALADDTFTVGNPYEDGDGYYVDVTVTPDSYIAAYNEGGSEHALADPDQDKVITFSHDGTKWVAKDGESPLVLEIMCNDAPAGPTDEQVKELIGDVKVDCVNDEAYHVTGTYALMDNYGIGVITGNVENGFTVDVAVPSGGYVDQYTAETNVAHELVEGAEESAVVTLVNTGEGWKVQSGTPVVFEVVCENVPEVPTFDELGKIFADGLVTVDCINDEVDPAHADKTYGVLKGSYLFGNVKFDGTNYTVTMDVYPAAYAQQYSVDTQVNHWLDPASQAAQQVTLTHNGTSWTAPAGFQTIRVSVDCEDAAPEVPPVPPTGDELAAITGADITVTCTGEGSHGYVSYDPTAGAYTFGEVTKGTDGTYSVTMTVLPSAYVDQFVTEIGEDHVLAEGENVAKTLTLTYDGAAWNAASEAINYNVVCVEDDPSTPEVPDMPTPDEVKALLGDDAVLIDCVNEDADHADKTYALVDGAFTIDPVEGDETNGYTCSVTVTPHTYVALYEQDMQKAHELVDGQSAATVGLKFDNGAWVLSDPAAQISYQVVCADEPGTDEPGTTVPGGDKPGTDEPGTDDPDTTHTVTIVFGNGDPDQPVEVDEGELLPRPADPTRDGYSFAGWFTTKNPDGTLSDPYDFSKPATGDFTLYAGWTLNGGTTTARPSAGVPATGDPTSVAALVATLVAGAGASTAGIALRRRNR